jgi:hypothetical protein
MVLFVYYVSLRLWKDKMMFVMSDGLCQEAAVASLKVKSLYSSGWSVDHGVTGRD